MPISSISTPKIQYAGSGTVGPFNTVFVFNQAADLTIIKTSTAGTDTTLTLITDYTVSGGSYNDGSVTLVSPLLSGEVLTILRTTAQTQEADYVSNDKFPAETHEAALNKLTLLVQDLNNSLSRVPKLKDSTISGPIVFPEPDALKYIRWNAAGTSLENTSSLSSGLVIATVGTGLTYDVGSEAISMDTTIYNKIVGIESNADVTDEDNVTDALDGASLTAVTVATDDKVMVQDTSDSDNLKTVTVQSIVDLAGSGSLNNVIEDTTPQLGGDLDLNSNDITGTGDINITGAITTSGTVNGRLIATDGSKLDGIESNATADQTGAEIKSAYEAEANTNAFTDADHSKLDGIEASADVTDETNVKASLDGATISNVTVNGSDKVLIQDISDSDNLKSVTAQSIADLAVDTTLSQEQVEDFVGGMVTGNTETLITVTYQDGDGTLDFVVDNDLSNYDNSSSNFITSAGAPVQSVNSTTGTVVLDADDIDDTSTTHKFTSAADISKLAGIEASADVTDETNVKAALDGATVTSATVAGTDKVLIQDTNDSDNLKTVTAQSIADLASGTQLTQEEVEDYAGALVATGGTKTGITVTYQDATGDMDFVVSNTTVAGDSGSTALTPGDTLTIAGGTNVSTSVSGDTITIDATPGGGGSGVTVQVDGSNQSVDLNTLDFDGTDFTLTESPADDFDITINVERIQDIVGSMFSGNTETLISATYQDADGTIDLVVDEASIDHDSLSGFVANEHIDWTSTSANFNTSGTVDTGALDVTGNITVSGTVDGRDLATDGTKLDGIETGADVTDEANVVSSLDGATLTAVIVAGTDKVLVQDTSDSDNIKSVTAQSIADLASSGGTPGGSDTQIQYNNSGSFGGDSGFTTNGSGSVTITGDLDVDNININGNTITSTDTNGDITLDPNGTGNVSLGNFTFDADQSVGAGQDNYVLTYDNSSGNISLEAAAGGGGGGLTSTIISDTSLGSDSATIEFTDLDDYKAVDFYLVAISPKTSNSVLRLEVSDDNGSTWKSSGYVSKVGYTNDSISGLYNITDYVILTAAAGTSTNDGTHGTLRMRNHGESGDKTYIDVHTINADAAGNDRVNVGACLYDTAGVIDAVRFYYSSGDVASGSRLVVIGYN